METRGITKEKVAPPSKLFSEVFNKLLGVGPDVFSIPRRPKQGIGFKKTVRLMDEIYCSPK